MGLPPPNLDDKTFSQLVLEGRSLIPAVAPEWTDHNVHDPGITFLELFAWLAEIEHYRLNRPSAEIYARFFSLIGLKREGRRPAEAVLESEFDVVKKAVFVPANTSITAIGYDAVPFQTLRDAYLSTADLREVITFVGGRETHQINAEDNLLGHYAAFGPHPEVGDYIKFGFKGWFNEKQNHLDITLFEDDLPRRNPFTTNAVGFVSSAKIRWEYFTESGVWSELKIIEDGTLNFSRSGEVVFHKPEQKPFAKEARTSQKWNWVRAIVVDGGFEIPPRIFSVVTNTLRARQVELIVNEDLGRGLGTPDLELRLRKSPLLIAARPPDGRYQVGEVLDWPDLISRLTHPEKLSDLKLRRAVEYLVAKLKEHGLKLELQPSPAEREGDDREQAFNDRKYELAQIFDKLLRAADFYQPKELEVIRQTEEFIELKTEMGRACQAPAQTRRFNRFLLQRIFPDLFLSDRIEIQTDLTTTCVPGGTIGWGMWERVDDFRQSGPDDPHFTLNEQTGVVAFGNGLNGRIPQPEESIRARFYRISQGEQGNLSAGKRWTLALPIEVPPDSKSKLWKNSGPTVGGSSPESLDAAKARSREVFQKGSPVLTIKDYEAAALLTPGLRVARAKVIPNFNPRLRRISLPGEMTIIVVPQAVFPSADPTTPSAGFIKSVFNHLETLRMVTTNLHVIGPVYEPVSVSCRIYLKKRAAEKDAKKSIEQALKNFLEPPFDGSRANAGWPLGRSVFPSEIHQLLSKLEFVDYVVGLSLNKQKAGEALTLPYNGLPKSGEHSPELISFERRKDSPPASLGDSNCE